MSTYIYNGGVIQPTYSADGKKITGLVNYVIINFT